MSAPNKDVVRDLMAGQLPWPQVRQIMSAYKDDDRFQRMIQVLQDRVPWDNAILLPVSEHLFITESDEGRVTRCECGHSFGHYKQNWKLNALINVRADEATLREIYPNSDIPDPDWMEIREFICPSCGTIHEVEAAAPGYPIVHDFEPDLEGFYAQWLGNPLAPERK